MLSVPHREGPEGALVSQLPVEIIRLIVQLALTTTPARDRDRRRYPTLGPLLLVNSTWSAVTGDVAYKHLRFETDAQLQSFFDSPRPAAVRSVASARLGLLPGTPPPWHRYGHQHLTPFNPAVIERLAEVTALRELWVYGLEEPLAAERQKGWRAKAHGLDLSAFSNLSTLHLEESPLQHTIARGGLANLRRLTYLSPMNAELSALFSSPTEFPSLRELVLTHYFEIDPLYTSLPSPTLPPQITSLALLVSPSDYEDYDDGSEHTNLLSMFTSLERLVLGGTHLITPGHFPSFVARLATDALESLALEAGFARDEDVLDALRNAPALQNLNTLRISYSAADREEGVARPRIRDLCATRGVELELRYLSIEELEERRQWDWYTQEFGLI